MDFMNIGSINSYIKTMDMENKWRTKKNSGNFAADGAKTVGEWMEKQKKKAEEKRSALSDLGKKGDSTLANINYKLSRGARLTPAEKEYLRKKDTAAYQRVQNIEAEQKDFENKLRQCKTKDEVRRLKLAYAASALSSVNSIKNSPYISDGAKAALISEQQQKMAAIDRSHSDFVKSGEFSSLPTDAERAAAAKKLANAENGNDERETHEDREPKKVKVVSHDKDGKVKIEEKEATKVKKSKGARKIAARAKAEQSYEVRKVRRSRKPFRSTAAGGDIISAGSVSSKTSVSVTPKQTVSVTPKQTASTGQKFDARA
ncbi:MAG: hypothetical protein K2K57_01375 [Oscillospiraceae bacterium]|nr:hypothetical protein [Oscillospiraceae bacterium]